MRLLSFLLAALLLASCSGGDETPEATDTPPAATPAEESGPPKAAGAGLDGSAEAPSLFEAPADVAEIPGDALKSESGLAWKVLKPGDGGKVPTAEAKVTVHYKGWQTNGVNFDSSYKRNKPAIFPLNRVIAGWTEGVALMTKGESRRFWIPEELAYKGRPGAPSGMLVFDIELVEWEEPPAPLPAPADVAAAPADATTTESGLAWKSLKAGDGAHPAETDRVRVHYTGWTTDGKQFDSSVQRGRPAVFPLNKVIPGWTEGLQLLQVGGSGRFWIPVELAYKGRPGAPAGMLVFDVELLEILAAPVKPAVAPTIKKKVQVKPAPE
jgi:FKBP-type peptidyl-prolyl cis-trans isomerase